MAERLKKIKRSYNSALGRSYDSAVEQHEDNFEPQLETVEVGQNEACVATWSKLSLTPCP